MGMLMIFRIFISYGKRRLFLFVDFVYKMERGNVLGEKTAYSRSHQDDSSSALVD
jgi:hypothetical protein